jgi:hypothetical protein
VKDAAMATICSLNDLRTLMINPSDLAVRKELAHLEEARQRLYRALAVRDRAHGG